MQTSERCHPEGFPSFQLTPHCSRGATRRGRFWRAAFGCGQRALPCGAGLVASDQRLRLLGVGARGKLGRDGTSLREELESF